MHPRYVEDQPTLGPSDNRKLGGPGVGKGTHCKKLAEHFPPLEHLSVGDLLREEAKESNAEDRGIIHGAMKAGGLAPNERVQAVLEKHLLKHISRGKTCFLLDGFPRSMEQATAFKARVSGVHQQLPRSG